MKRYICKQFTGCNLNSGYIYAEIEEFINRYPEYDLDKMTSTGAANYISVIVVMKLRED